MNGIIVGLLVVAGILVPGAALTGNGKTLCDALGGTYTPQNGQVEACPGGSWTNVFRIPEKPKT